MTPDPREVASVAEAIYLEAESSINHDNVLPWATVVEKFPGDSDRYEAQARAAIAADHQWLAEHAPEAVKQAVEALKQAAIRCEVGADGYDKVVVAETALLALYQRPVIDEEAVERMYQTITSRRYTRTHDAIRAALEAFVAGGGEG